MTDTAGTDAVPPPVATPANGMTSRQRRSQAYQARQARKGRGGGRGNTALGTAPREKTKEKMGIQGIPSFCTPADNGDKARFNKARNLLKSHVVQNFYQGKDVTTILRTARTINCRQGQQVESEDLGYGSGTIRAPTSTAQGKQGNSALSSGSGEPSLSASS